MEETVQAFQALGDPTRLRLLKAILSVKAQMSVCVCELVDALELPQYHVSRHLQQLKDAGWLQAQRRGTWVYYAPADDLPSWQRVVLNAVRDHLDEPIFQQDAKRLRARMSVRRAGLCVIGYAKT